jgi:glycosyltransferase involved in cell wall biosynthesis
VDKLDGLPLVSVIIATKNEEKNIENCIKSINNQTYPSDKIELLVVDNNSTDRTKEIAKRFSVVYNRGPKRASQLNFGVGEAKGKYILYPDADMILSEKIVEECVNKCEGESCIALYIPEKIIGRGFWIKVRDFERSFYNTSCIDAVRFVKKEKFLQIGGFDENIDFGPDDWDFNRRIGQTGKIDIIKSPVFHNEGDFHLKRYLKKKNNYSTNFDKYIEKWGQEDPIIQKQVGAWYRLVGVFIENGKWSRLMAHPVLSLWMYALRIMVGFQYLKEKVVNEMRASD